MASGVGTYTGYAAQSFLVGLTAEFNQAKLITKSGSVVMSDTLSFTWANGANDDEFRGLNVSGGAKVFTISQAGTVNALRLENSSGVLKAVIDLTPVVYETPTFYTLSELILYFDLGV